MPVDPSNPDTFEDFDQEDADVTEFDAEAPEADAAEQHADLAPQHDDSLGDVDPGTANVADIAEQARVVDLDEDDYR
ncbi:hypothetical protein B7P34_34595 [Streptosporangium nondiastaticum]|uniref:Uncharacterized protein n=1 Tax=Streptosporangium nondiastaticum TaxID=35764 RepID=A0A9X7JI87_9ACTN|nr:hypothetical protein [Streptosporangium nondiastaticum]PSJ24213.1 hypothetical protein B7P34_34595 [Streptosporangium nondiastaticum]